MQVFYFKAVEHAVGFVEEERRLDQARATLGGGGRLRRVQVQERKSLGRGPSRRAVADGFILSFGAGVYFDSNQRHSAMGLFQLRGRSSSSPTATAGEGDLESLLVAKDSMVCL